MNSGGIIGYATDIYDIIADSDLKDDDDDQLFYTKIFLNKPTRVIFKIFKIFKAFFMESKLCYFINRTGNS